MNNAIDENNTKRHELLYSQNSKATAFVSSLNFLVLLLKKDNLETKTHRNTEQFLFSFKWLLKLL